MFSIAPQRHFGLGDSRILNRWSFSWDRLSLSWVWIELPNLPPKLNTLYFCGLNLKIRSCLKSSRSLLRVSYLREERVGEVAAIFRIVAIVFVTASEIRVYVDRWHTFSDLRSRLMYVDFVKEAE